jgi:lysylphosphatidylglycerol synthetase-like protein (DUF2156 family)
MLEESMTMRRVAGHILVIAGIVTAPPMWDEMARGGLWTRIAFAGVLASIVVGLVLAFGAKTNTEEKGRRA